MKVPLHRLLLFVSIAWTISASQLLNASGFIFSHITTNEGLSQGTVLAGCQDMTGQMWFGTQDGLNRYDGYKFTGYRNNPDDPKSIAGNIIRHLSLDNEGNLWIGTDKGLSQYDSRKDCFRNFSMEDKVVTGIADIGDRLLVASGGSLRFFDTVSMEWAALTPPQQNESFGATAIHRHGNDIYIGTEKNGLFIYSVISGELTKITAFDSTKAIQCMMMVGDSSLWIATEGDGLFLLDTQKGETRNFRHSARTPEGISSNYVRTLSTDSKGRLWVGTFNGLSIMENGSFTNIKCDPFTTGSLSQSSIRCICRDSQGGMWLGTWFGGINYWHPLRNRFTNIQRQATGNSLNDNVISCISEARDKSLWIGTNSGGVNHYDSRTGKFSHYSMRTDRFSDNLENDIKAIYIDEEKDMVYVGAHAGGLNIIDRKTGRIRHCGSQDEKGNPMDVYAILRLDSSHLYIGTLNGLKSYDMNTGAFRDILTDCQGRPIVQTNIMAMLEDSQKRLWIGGENGIASYLITDKGLKECLLPIPAEVFNKTIVQCIYESSTADIWIATRNGLYSYDEAEGRLQQYTIRDGLPSDRIHGIEEDSYGRLWISTDNGLSCFNPFSQVFRNFNVADGLQSSHFTTYSHCRRSDGEMMFGGVNGITAFYPENIKDNPFTPQPLITSLQVFNRSVRPDDGSGIIENSIISSEEIKLNHRQNSFTIEFSVPNYLSGHHDTFAYMLEGFDKDWYETGNRTVSYSNLPHGKYRFMVKAANNDGKWNEEPAIIDIHIKPVWYRTTAAITAFIIMLLLIITGAYTFIIERKNREGRIELDKQEKAHQEELHQMKIRFFINISHEMRTPLTLIINPLSEMIAKSSDIWMRKQLRYVERNAKKLLHLVNQLMDYRRAELGVFKLKVRPENVHKIVRENWSFYEKLAYSKKIRYSLFSDIEGKTMYIDGQYLELILNNLLSNAFKYTDTGSITVRVSEQESNLMIEVSDTGTGIPIGKQGRIFERFYQIDSTHIGSGIGLSLVQRLVELHHGQLRLQSEEGKGSTFTVLLPLTLSLYSPAEFGNDGVSETHTSNTHDMYMIDTEKQEAEQMEEDESKKGRILIVEDNEEIREYMREGLARYFDITLAGNGEEAMQRMKENEPEVVITDMMMPVMDGLKLCANIKQNIRTCHIPVIILSAKTDNKDHLAALKAGADDYMAKPFSMSILIAKIQNIMRTVIRIHNKATHSMEIEPEKISFNAMDEQILSKAIAIVEQNIDNTEFSTEDFAKEMNMSRSNLHIKLKALTGESALDFIRKIRFKEACRLLKDGRYSISEISDMVGFNTPSYFATCFKKYMGCLPTEYIKKKI